MRKKMVAGMIVLVGILSVASSVAPARADIVIFRDTFSALGGSASDYYPANPWTQIFGTWTVAGGVYGASPAASADDTSSFAGDTSWTNYVLEADWMMPTSITSHTHMGMKFRYQGNVPRGPGAGYYVDYWTGQLRLIKNWGTYLGTASWAPAADQWYHLKVDVQGSSIKVYLDGVLKISVTDTTYASGKIGLWCCNYYNDFTGKTQAYFDNVVVTILGYDFQWLPPLSLEKAAYKSGSTIPIKFAVKYNGAFLRDESVRVEVYGPGPSGPLVFSAVYAPEGDTNVRINDLEGFYIVNWHLEGTFVGQTYTIKVLFGATLFGSIVVTIK